MQSSTEMLQSLCFRGGDPRTKKSPQKTTAVEGMEESAESVYQAVPCSGVEELVGLPSLCCLVRWSVYKQISWKLLNFFCLCLIDKRTPTKFTYLVLH